MRDYKDKLNLILKFNSSLIKVKSLSPDNNQEIKNLKKKMSQEVNHLLQIRSEK